MQNLQIHFVKSFLVVHVLEGYVQYCEITVLKKLPLISKSLQLHPASIMKSSKYFSRVLTRNDFDSFCVQSPQVLLFFLCIPLCICFFRPPVM